MASLATVIHTGSIFRRFRNLIADYSRPEMQRCRHLDKLGVGTIWLVAGTVLYFKNGPCKRSVKLLKQVYFCVLGASAADHKVAKTG